MQSQYENVSKEYYDARIQLIAGDPGVGKSFFCLNHPLRNRGFYLDLEGRYPDQLELTGIDLDCAYDLDLLKVENPDVAQREEINRILYDPDYIKPPLVNQYALCKVIDDNWDTDKVKTLERTTGYLEAVVHNPNIKLIVIDGIWDLRIMCMEAYEQSEGKAAFGFQAWGKINNMVKKRLYKVFNYCRSKNIQLIMTTFLDDVYQDGNLTEKKVVGTKKYILREVDEVIALSRNGIDYFQQRGKSPHGASEPVDWTVEKNV